MFITSCRDDAGTYHAMVSLDQRDIRDIKSGKAILRSYGEIGIGVPGHLAIVWENVHVDVQADVYRLSEQQVTWMIGGSAVGGVNNRGVHIVIFHSKNQEWEMNQAIKAICGRGSTGTLRRIAIPLPSEN